MNCTVRHALRGLGVMIIVLGLIAGIAVARPRAGAVASAATAARAVGAVTTTETTVQVGDVTRDYELGGAPAVAGGNAPLLLLFHGLDQATTDFLGDINILTAAAQAGVVVAAPESPDNSWNDGRFGSAGLDDDGFAMAIISQLAGQGVIDPARVTVGGFSNGAGMAMEVASLHPSAVAALVSVDGELLSGTNQVLPSGPVPAFFIHGTDDPVQPIDGRVYESDRYPGYISEQDTINAFLAVDGEAGVLPTTAVAPAHKSLLVGATTVTRWAQPGSVPVTFASVARMGHKWPVLACTPAAVPASVTARLLAAKRTSSRLTTAKRHVSRPETAHQKRTIASLKKQLATQNKAATKARAASALDTATRQAAVAAMLPSTGVTGCEIGGGVNTRATDLSADGLILGVAVSAHQGSTAP